MKEKKETKEKKATVTVTRKITLRPVISDDKFHLKKIKDFILKDSNEKLDYYQGKKKKDKKDEQKITFLQKMISDAQNDVITQKMVNDYTYDLVRSSMESEARRKNYILSWIFSEMIANGVQFMDFKAQCKFISETVKSGYRVKGSKKGSIFDDVEIANILQGYGIAFSKTFTSKITKAVRDGLLDGKVALPTYKLNSPFSVAKNHIAFVHDYDTFDELAMNIRKPGCRMYMNFGANSKPTIAKFMLDTGTKGNKEELNTTLLRIFSGEYQVCGSSIGLCKDGKKIVVNLSIEIPQKEIELDENIVVGVDVGIKVPAYCALNTDIYKREPIGDSKEFFRIKKQLQEQRRRLSSQVKCNNGGHGRNKKMKPLEKFSERERNFVKTYNHYVSKAVIDFAIKNRAKYINLEDLSGIKNKKLLDNRILRDWSYYELQQFIEYKASKYGINVRYIDPYLTSQVCSHCGHWEEGQRKSQSEFVCKKCGYTANADFNAARNIAMTKIVEME